VTTTSIVPNTIDRFSAGVATTDSPLALNTIVCLGGSGGAGVKNIT
jgi:hypothetical protein